MNKEDWLLINSEGSFCVRNNKLYAMTKAHRRADANKEIEINCDLGHLYITENRVFLQKRIFKGKSCILKGVFDEKRKL